MVHRKYFRKAIEGTLQWNQEYKDTPLYRELLALCKMWKLSEEMEEDE